VTRSDSSPLKPPCYREVALGLKHYSLSFSFWVNWINSDPLTSSAEAAHPFPARSHAPADPASGPGWPGLKLPLQTDALITTLYSRSCRRSKNIWNSFGSLFYSPCIYKELLTLSDCMLQIRKYRMKQLSACHRKHCQHWSWKLGLALSLWNALLMRCSKHLVYLQLN